MNARILNRDFTHPADGFYQIEAKGDHPNRAANVVQVIDEEAITAIVNRFNADAKAGALSQGSEMLIDIEHFKDQPDKESRAYGWLQELKNRADGIYGRIRWTGTGKEAVDGGDYRFFSTEYGPGDVKFLNDGKPRRVRPLRLDGLTLTNMNNNKGQKPITNRAPNGAADNPQPNERQTMKSVATKLGLSPDASEEAILADVTKLLNRGDISIADLNTLRNEAQTLKTDNTALLDEQIDGVLAERNITDTKIINRLKPMLKPLKNRADRIACLDEIGFDGEEETAETETAGKVLNRNDGKTPNGAGAGANTEQERVQKQEAEIDDYRIKNRCTYEVARDQVRRKQPGLFIPAKK
jgi:phage I-like protein